MKTVNVTIPSGKHTLRVDHVDWTGTANVSFAYAPRTSATVDKVAPLTTAGTSATYDDAGEAKPPGRGGDGPRRCTYRRLKGSPFGATPLATTTTATSYSDTTLQTGATYYYEVRTYDKAGNESSGTADGVLTADLVAPAAPTIVRATGEVTPTGGNGRAGCRLEQGRGRHLVPSVHRAASAGRVHRARQHGPALVPGHLGRRGDRLLLPRHSRRRGGQQSARSDPQRGKIWDNDPPSLVTGLSVTPTPSTASG
ncbi:hypothetical protein SALBM311S_04948 [Streptomyces alboniger]